MKNIVIIGGGFAGCNLAKKLDKNYTVTLVDRNNYTFFPPLLYQVATGFLEPSAISYPFRKMLRKYPNVKFRMGEMLGVNTEEKKVLLSSGEIYYDYLVFAAGTETNFFGLKNVKEQSIPMKNISDALEMRNRLLMQLERATTIVNNKAELRKKLTLVVAGGGPTGVEISGMLAEMKHSVFKKDYPELRDLDAIDIYLVDAAQQLLSPMSSQSKKTTFEELQKLGVKILLNTQVLDYVDGKVLLSNGEQIKTENLFWTSGVTSQIFSGIPSNCFGSGGRLITDSHNKVVGLEDVFAIGDNSIQLTDSKFPNGHPQVAQVALQQGEHLAHNFNRVLKHKNMIAFKYADKGSLAIIGRNKAVADLASGLHFKGFAAWFIWVFVHLMSLVHYRNRAVTFRNWVVAYFTKDQALRMIISAKKQEVCLK